jgi:NADH-quinone oxidoreductase subunit E
MLSPEEQAEIEAEFPNYPNRSAVCIDALRIVQKHRGWISDEALAAISEFLGVSKADLDGLATFYNLIFRRPVGRHVIYLCDSVSCWMMGAQQICRDLCEQIHIRPGESTPDGRFTLLPIVCLGACDHAPAMMIDEDLHGDLTTKTIGRILERYP